MTKPDPWDDLPPVPAEEPDTRPESGVERRARRERRLRLHPLFPVVAIVVLSLILTAACVIVYTGTSQQRSDKRWCALLSSLDQPEVPATTERGLQIQRQIHQLKVDFDC